jgi:hypothetical protein
MDWEVDWNGEGRRYTKRFLESDKWLYKIPIPIRQERDVFCMGGDNGSVTTQTLAKGKFLTLVGEPRSNS